MSKILILKCSPRRNGNSDILADSFIKGATEAGHEIITFNIGNMKINPCLACYQCFKTDKPCIQNDDMQSIYPEFVSADAIVIAAPVYYFSFPSQYKCFIDRVLPYDVEGTMPTGRKAALLMTAGDNETMFEAAITEFKKVYGEWFESNIKGIITVPNVDTKGAIKDNPKLEEAYNLGKAI